MIWQMLGELYRAKSQEGQKNDKELQFNIEKSIFCFTKAAKYEA